jgi:signal transduction histidine kinase/ActR/RegA family two-component response regulator
VSPGPAQDRGILALSGVLLGALALVAPLGYLLLTVRYEAGAMETEAAAVSQALSGLATANPDLWRYESVRLEEILARRMAPGAPRRHRVLDRDGAVVATNGVEVPPPRQARSAPVLDAGLPLGSVEVVWSVRPALLRALGLAAAFAPGAVGIFLLLRAALRRAAAARAAAEAQLRRSQRLETVGRLAGGVAHDFNNLLAAVMGFARELRDELPAGSPLQEPVEEILQASQRGAQVTRSLLAFARQQSLGLTRLDAGELLRRLERLLGSTLARGQTLRLALAAEPLPLEVDLVQLELVLVNLAANARDAMEPAGTLRIETSGVTLERAAALPAGRYVRIAVHDDGAGMAEETRHRIFDPFFTTKPVGRGTGLGLAIAHGVVQQHRGAIEVDSAPGQGTTFTILLPRASPRPGRAGHDAAAAAGGAPRGQGELVLVAEDDPRVRRVLRNELRRAGYEVVDVADGAEAVRIATTRQGELAVLLLDVAMPGRSGPEALAELRAAGVALPALFLTGNPGELGETPGAEVLLKPVDPDALLRAVRRVLEDGRGEAGAAAPRAAAQPEA